MSRKYIKYAVPSVYFTTAVLGGAWLARIAFEQLWPGITYLHWLGLISLFALTIDIVTRTQRMHEALERPRTTCLVFHLLQDSWVVEEFSHLSSAQALDRIYGLDIENTPWIKKDCEVIMPENILEGGPLPVKGMFLNGNVFPSVVYYEVPCS